MSQTGANSENLLIVARETLLNALEALEEQREALIVIGAQAVYLRTGDLDVALAPATTISPLTPGSFARIPFWRKPCVAQAFSPARSPVHGWTRTESPLT